jgi:aspartate oxidase
MLTIAAVSVFLIAYAFIATEKIFSEHFPTYEIREFRNLTLTANILVHAALAREESRGCHYRSDFPDANKKYEIRIIFFVKLH